MSDYTDLMKKLQILDNNYRKEVSKEKQNKVLALYEKLCEVLDESTKNVYIEIDSGEYDVTVIITSSHDLLISEYDVILNKLLNLADTKNINIQDENIVLKLWFRCWEFRKR